MIYNAKLTQQELYLHAYLITNVHCLHMSQSTIVNIDLMLVFGEYLNILTD